MVEAEKRNAMLSEGPGKLAEPRKTIPANAMLSDSTKVSLARVVVLGIGAPITKCGMCKEMRKTGSSGAPTAQADWRLSIPMVGQIEQLPSMKEAVNAEYYAKNEKTLKSEFFYRPGPRSSVCRRVVTDSGLGLAISQNSRCRGSGWLGTECHQ